MAMVQNGTLVGDGSWILAIAVTDLKVGRKLRVRGDMHIGGLMLRLVEELDVTRDWSDHALWWPNRRKWLTHTRSTLDQLGVTAETELEFTPMHKVARVQLPDLQTIDARLDYSVPIFNAVVHLCKELGLRYPEELSLKRYISPDHLKRGLGFEQDAIKSGPPPLPGTLKKQTPISASVSNISQPRPSPAHIGAATTDSLPRSGVSGSPMGTLQSQKSSNGFRSPVVTSLSWGQGLSGEQYEPALVNSPRIPVKSAVQTGLWRPKDLEQKAALNRGWLDSSRSLMEQGVFEGDLVLLRFKFTQYFDINPKYDPIRVNQLFEQAKWSVLMEEFDCTEEEALVFAALQLQSQLMQGAPEPTADEGTDVDIMLDDLETTLDAAAAKREDLTTVPELSEYLKYMKPKKLTLKGWKRAFFTFRDLYLSWYPTVSDARGPPLGRFCLKGCEVSPDVNMAQNKYSIKLLVPSAEGMHEFVLRCDSEHQYVRWMAGCRLAARGKTMADASYPQEVESLKRLLQMQQTTMQSSSSAKSPSRNAPPQAQLPNDIKPEEYLPARYVERARSRQHLVQRLSESYANVKSLSCTESKLQYIRAWQALPEHGLHYFVVRFRGAKKNELLAVAFNRLMKLNLDDGDSLKTWRFNTMKRWHVNWEIKHVLVQYEEENVEFKPVSADCKVVHEFIGGYIFLSMRSKDQNQTLNEPLFHKLTSGWA